MNNIMVDYLVKHSELGVLSSFTGSFLSASLVMVDLTHIQQFLAIVGSCIGIITGVVTLVLKLMDRYK